MRHRIFAIAATALLLFLAGAPLFAQPTHDLCLYYTEPADDWHEAVPIGSGRLGAMVFGGLSNERIQFNEDTLWTGKPHDYVRQGAGDRLREIRESILAGRGGGNSIRETFLSDPIRQKAYQPFGDLKLTFPADHRSATDYRRELDLTTALATVTYRVGDVTYRREVFASYPDNAIVVRLSASQPGRINCGLELTSPHSMSQSQSRNGTIVLRGVVQDPKNNNEQGLKFEGRLIVRNEGGAVESRDNGVRVGNADAVTLLIVAATSYVNFQDITADPSKRCDAYVEQLKDRDYASLRSRQKADHQGLFDRVKLDLGRTDQANLPTDRRLSLVNQAVGAAGRNPQADAGAAFKADPAFATLYFQMGRYMLICSSRLGTQPANLQGVWNELLDPPWESKYTTNINFEMNYWPAETTNLAECHGPFFDVVDDLRITGARTARKQYGAGGWVLHHNTDHWRGTAPINNVDGLWPTGAAWLCHHMWDHYLYSGDREFLQKRAYPAMKEACQFFLDFLIKDPETGYLVTCPSHSPEQHAEDKPLLGYGPTMDNQLIRSLFTYTIDASKALGVDSEFAAKLVETRKQLPPNLVGQHGQLQEWIKDWDTPNNRHRHMSPLWGLFPGWDITPADPKVFEAAKKLLTWRGDGDTGWSYSWRMGLWARVHDGETAYRQIYLQLAKKTFPNLFDKCGPFQVDGNFGTTGAIGEMLIQSHLRDPKTGAHEVHLLPAVPKAWSTGSITGLRARGGFEIDMKWENGSLMSAIVRSKLGNPLVLRFGEKRVEMKTTAGEAFATNGRLERSN